MTLQIIQESVLKIYCGSLNIFSYLKQMTPNTREGLQYLDSPLFTGVIRIDYFQLSVVN
jgi:hypothetical protein